MKQIDTLVKDIYHLFDSNHKPHKENIQALATTLAETITSRMGEKPRGTGALRLSMIGRPDRQIWYECKGYPKFPIPPAAKIKFLYGDILEAMLLFLAREAGHKVEHEQKEVEVEGVKGHIDAVIDDTLIDVKSASVFGFKKFKEKTIIKKGMFGYEYDDPFGYVHQLGAYARAMGKSVLGWLAIEKEKGHVALPLHTLDEFPDSAARIKHLKIIIQDEQPPAKCFEPVPYGDSGNLALAVGCGYCGFKYECWKDANNGQGIRTFLYAKGPAELVEIKRQPQAHVKEITNEIKEKITKEEALDAS